jgi:hypothetical protein
MPPQMLQLQQSTANGRTYYTLSSQSGGAVHHGLLHLHGWLPAGGLQPVAARYGDSESRQRLHAAALRDVHGADPARPIRELLRGHLLQRLHAFAAAGAVQQAARREELAANLKPTLIAAYGENDRITFATSGSLFTTFGNMSLLQLLEKPGTHYTRAGS